MAQLEKIPASIHKMSLSSIPKSPKKIIQTLTRNSFECYLVGGCIRDNLMSIKPKDFDIATNATPEQIKKLIPRSRIIGRRFKLVHVRNGRGITEVATFRSDNIKNISTKEGMVLRDNYYGNSKEDALRRDLTINSLFYDIKTQDILDFTGGYGDCINKKIRIIGDIETRFKEDPIRMLRAVRFSSKLSINLDHTIENKIFEMGKLLLNIPPARRLDEINKLFLYGKAYETFKLLNKLDLLRYLFPSLTLILNKRDKNMYYTNFIETSLKETDNRIKINKPVMLPFFLSCMLWPSLAEKIGEITSSKTKLSELRLNALRIIYSESEFCSIPKRMQSSIIEIWEFQIRLLKTNTPRANDLIRHKRFRAGYDFLINREKAGLYLNDLGYWWTNFQRTNPKQRQKMINISKKFGTKKITKTPKSQQIDIELKLE